MEKKGAQLFIGALAAGIVATSGITGAATINGNTETTETVEYTMQENLNDIYYESIYQKPCITIITDNEYKDISQCDSIGEVVRGLPKGLGYKRLYLKGYDGEVLVVTDTIVKKGGKNTSNHAWFYTKTHGEPVHYVGALNTSETDYPLRKIDGIINASDSRSYHTYYLSPDGISFVDYDFVYLHVAVKGTYHGTYYNYSKAQESNLEERLRKEIENTPVIDFDIK